MNQVYFYIAEQMDNVRQEKRQVLIPLWIRSISTKSPPKRALNGILKSLNPFMNQVYFYPGGALQHRAGRIQMS